MPVEESVMTPAMPTMAAAERLALAALLAFVLASTPLLAQNTASPPAHPEATQQQQPHTDTAHPPHNEAAHPNAEHVCLNQKERRAETDGGKLIRLSAAMHAALHRHPGTVVQARLCHGKDGLVYVLTVLARDGKVARISVDAVKGDTTADR